MVYAELAGMSFFARATGGVRSQAEAPQANPLPFHPVVGGARLRSFRACTVRTCSAFLREVLRSSSRPRGIVEEDGPYSCVSVVRRRSPVRFLERRAI